MNRQAQEQLEACLRLFQDHHLEELVVEDESFKLRLRRRPVQPPPPSGAQAAGPALRQPVKKSGRTVAVRSPLVGIFYRAPAPDAPAFVQVGDLVEEGQTVCVVEAMKVFNEIKAEWSGRVVAIPAQDGKLVQAGEPLVVLEFLREDGEGKEGL